MEIQCRDEAKPSRCCGTKMPGEHTRIMAESLNSQATGPHASHEQV